MSISESPSPRFGTGFVLVSLVLAVELAAIGLIYKHLIDFDCRANWPGRVCSGASGLMVSVYTLTGALILLSVLLPDGVRRLIAAARPARFPLTVNLLGVVAMLAPLPMMREGSGTANLASVLSLWAIGIALGGAGALLMVAPVPRWKAFLGDYGLAFGFTTLAGLLVPVIARKIQPLWDSYEGLADLTFAVSAWLIGLIGMEVEAYPETKIIGAGDFFISIAPVCSGIEGIALVSAFITIYLVLFRRELAFPRALILYPIGVVLSAGLNIVRIVTLLAIGLNGQPGLAVEGFHSHAGWLMFTILAIGLVMVANNARWLHFDRGPRSVTTTISHPLPLRHDPIAAQILPFVVFMASALVAQTFSNVPGMLYPWRFLAMAVVLLFFARHYLALPWRLDLTSIIAGAGVGVLWLATAPAPAEPSELALALSGFGSVGMLIWVFCRVAGTTFLVPLIEEMFFRGYLMDSIAGSGSRWRVLVAIAISSVLFGVLHDRWLAAALSGVVFALLRLRSGRMTDAVLAHAVANGIIAAAAVLQSDWSLI